MNRELNRRRYNEAAIVKELERKKAQSKVKRKPKQWGQISLWDARIQMIKDGDIKES